MKNFETALSDAKKVLEANDYGDMVSVITGKTIVQEDVLYLAKYIDDQKYRGEVIKFVQEGFGILRESAEKQSTLKSYPNTHHIIDDRPFVNLGYLAQMLGEKSLAPSILKEFTFATDDEQDYELNVAGAYLAVVLSILDFKEAINPFNDFLKNYEYRYAGEEFVMKVRYSMWLINRDVDQPVQYLKDPKSVAIGSGGKIGNVSGDLNRSLGWVFAALADLNAKESLPLLKDFKSKITNPVAMECLIEAIERLEKQDKPPLPKDRMAWLFGMVTSTEMVLGGESDNVFIKRAREKTKNDELGNITEADESATKDID